MMSDLSLMADLIEEILSRVPATSLKRLRSTCKQWNALFKDPRFTEKHSRRAPKQFQIFMLKKYKVCSMSINLNITPPSIEFKGALDLKDSHSNSEQQVDIVQVFHCDGLLLSHTKENRLVVWNPFLGETKWIQSKTAYNRFSKFALGYQNNKSCRSYKILRYSQTYNRNGQVFAYAVYEFSSDTWRVLDDINPNFSILRCGGVSLKGNTYWLASDGASANDDQSLLYFDFTTEKFKRLCLPRSQNHNFLALSVVKEEQLSVLHKWPITPKMDIWVTNKVDTKSALLWSKLFTMDLHDKVYKSLLIDEEKKVALCCVVSSVASENKVYTIGEDDEYYSEIPFMENGDSNVGQFTNDPLWWPLIFNYAPSLVQIQQGRGKRKERN